MMMRSILAALATISLCVLCVYGYIYLYSNVAPQFQQAERQVFEQTSSYIQGKIVYLTRLQFQYENQPDEAVRASLKEMIKSEAATVDEEKLTPRLRAFLDKIYNN